MRLLTHKIKTGIISPLVLATFVMTAFTLYTDFPQMLKALWFGLVPGVIALVLSRTLQHIDFYTITRGNVGKSTAWHSWSVIQRCWSDNITNHIGVIK
jgi:hypothetical protein